MSGKWQCVTVVWGEKYGNDDVIRMFNGVRLHSDRGPVRFVAIVDRIRSGLPDAITQVPLAGFFADPALHAGRFTKLAMFEFDMVPTDCPAVYIDLDSMVIGDLGDLADLLDRPRRLLMLKSTLIPFGAVGRVLHFLTGGRRYARGNSSIMAYHPAHCHDIAAWFRDHYSAFGNLTEYGKDGDEAFISWTQQHRLRRVPSTHGVKFSTEFMFPRFWMGRFRAACPWVRRRREGIRVVTFPGQSADPHAMARMPDGQIILDHRGRKARWSAASLGSIRQTIIDRYAER